MDVCCKVAIGIGGQIGDCDSDILAGLRDLKIALLCYILTFTETAFPDTVVDDVVMKTTINDPIGGDDEFLFYQIGTEEKTLQHTFSWTCSEETNRKVYEESIEGQVPYRTPRAFNVLLSWMCKEVVCIGKEAGDDGQYIIVGLGGGLRLRDVNGGTGLLTADNNNTNIIINGTELTRPFSYLDAGGIAATEVLVDSISSTVI